MKLLGIIGKEDKNILNPTLKDGGLCVLWLILRVFLVDLVLAGVSILLSFRL